MMEDKKKVLTRVALFSVIALSLILGIVWNYVWRGEPTTKILPPEYAQETNPIARAKLVEGYNAIQGTVTLIRAESNSSYCYINLDPGDTYPLIDDVRVYLTKDDMATLHLGDIITVRGHIDYTYRAELNGKVDDDMSIGSSFTFPFMSYRASLVSIDQTSVEPVSLA